MIIPTMYYRNIKEINYEKLKKEGIKCLIFDLDNTLASLEEKECSKTLLETICKLKKDFIIAIITNSNKKRTEPYRKALDIDIVSFALKPSTKGLKKIKKKYNLKKAEMVMIGDQFMTDILSGTKFGIKTILVDALQEKDLKITKINRIIENRLINKYQKRNLFERGKYYE